MLLLSFVYDYWDAGCCMLFTEIRQILSDFDKKVVDILKLLWYAK